MIVNTNNKLLCSDYKRGDFLDTMLVFFLFFVALLGSIYQGISILYPLLFGLICFTLISLRRNFTLLSLVKMMGEGAKKSLLVIKIFVLIGGITAVWRACGTIGRPHGTRQKRQCRCEYHISADTGFIVYAFYLYLVPLTNLFTRKLITINDDRILLHGEFKNTSIFSPMK